MCPLQPVKLRITPVKDACAHRRGNGSSRWRITGFEVPCFPVATSVAFIAQLCDARAEHARALKPFVACCDLIIVIPLYAWERIRVMTINHKATDRDAMCFSGDAGAVSGECFEERGGVCG
jgi:hypothetical protein